MKMFRGSTPTIPIEIEGADLSQAKLFLTIVNKKQGKLFTLTTPDDFTVAYDAEHGKTVGEVTLTQEQTLAIQAGTCEAQIRYVFPDGSADATLKTTMTIYDVLMKGVISYE